MPLHTQTLLEQLIERSHCKQEEHQSHYFLDNINAHPRNANCHDNSQPHDQYHDHVDCSANKD
uniref:Uncharacterized protein n=1 Tax=Romanomermis culicivorax TaxID=13658 RepID=A0A915KD69_ROMCU